MMNAYHPGFGAIIEGGILDQGSGQLGGVVRLNPAGPAATPGDPLTGLRQRILTLSAQNKTKSQTFVLSLDLKTREQSPTAANPNPFPTTTNVLVRAHICWGSPKGNGSAEFDIKQGTRVSLEGTSLAVDVLTRFDNSIVTPPNNTGPPIEVYASVAAGSFGKGPQLTLTEPATNLLAIPSSIVVRIPPYAREFELQSSDNPLAGVPNTYNIDFLSAPVTGSRLISRHTGADTRIAIPNGAYGVEIANNGPAAAVVTPLFHLTL